MTRKREAGLWALVAFLALCLPAPARAGCRTPALAPQAIGSVTLLGTQEIRRVPGSATEHLGGISGLEFDPEAQRWYLLSDDRSQRAPARMYPARIAFDGAGFGAIEVLPAVELPLAAGEVPDPEALRLLPCTGVLVWASEGDRSRGQHPTVRSITPQGLPAGELALPANLRFSQDASQGARDNLTLEGLAPTPDGSALWLSMEAPLVQDGPVASLMAGAQVRFTRLPLAGGTALQRAYPLDAVPQAGSHGQRRADNGVSEILALANGELLVVERSGREVAAGEWAFDIRVYLTNPDGSDGADDVLAMPTLTGARALQKRLLLNLRSLGLPWVDNVEGAAWGPHLADGRATLVLISDDNFATNQVTQLIFLAVNPPAPPPVSKLTVLHTNDHHGRFWRNAQGEAGLAARKALVDAVRREVQAEGGHVLLLDAGDVNTGTPESDALLAEPDFRGMSLLGYDAMAVGNHEFDRAAATQLQQRGSWSAFPWLSANVLVQGQPAFDSHRVFTFGGLRVAVFGLTTEDTRQMGVATRYPGFEFKPAIAAAATLVPVLRAQADVLIALTHIGHYADGRHGVSAPGDVELARAVPGIDLVVGGHTHSLVCMLNEASRNETYEPGGPCAPDHQNGAWIVQAGDRGRFVGRADLEWRAGRLNLLRYTLLPVNLAGGPRLAENAEALALLAPFQQSATAGLGAVLGHAQGCFDGERASVRSRRTNLGVLVAQALMQAGDADLAVISSGGLRASLPDGDLTQRDLLTTLPFGNRLVVVSLSGRELLDYVAFMARQTPGSGAFAQYSGLSFDHTAQGPVDVRVAGRPLDPQHRYRLALPSFVAAGGDGYPDLRAHAAYRDTGLIDAQVLRDFIAARRLLRAADFEPPANP